MFDDIKKEFNLTPQFPFSKEGKHTPNPSQEGKYGDEVSKFPSIKRGNMGMKLASSPLSRGDRGVLNDKAEDIFAKIEPLNPVSRPVINEVSKKEAAGIKAVEKEGDFDVTKKKIIFIGGAILSLAIIIFGFLFLNRWINSTETVSARKKGEENQSVEQIPLSPLKKGGTGGIDSNSSPLNEGLPAQAGGQGDVGVRELEIKDTDGDGLTNDEETKLGTKVDKIDTDDDGLNDKEEVLIYKTDPLNSDTDADNYLDGAEVKAGYNPKGEGKLLEIKK